MFSYENIGSKIKSLAKTSFVVEAIAAVITGIALLLAEIDEGDFPFGLLVILAGPIVAWVSSWLIYGFGEIIDKLCDIEKNTRNRDKSPKHNIINNERISKIEKLRSQGLITEEEYQQAILKAKQEEE